MSKRAYERSNTSNYYYRKERGICVRCGKTAVQGRVLCEKCAEKQLKYDRERRCRS